MGKALGLCGAPTHPGVSGAGAASGRRSAAPALPQPWPFPRPPPRRLRSAHAALSSLPAKGKEGARCRPNSSTDPLHKSPRFPRRSGHLTPRGWSFPVTPVLLAPQPWATGTGQPARGAPIQHAARGPAPQGFGGHPTRPATTGAQAGLPLSPSPGGGERLSPSQSWRVPAGG